jgi:hypothetical protein
MAMSDAKDIFDEVVNQFVIRPGIVRSQMFGMPCLKVNGKAFAGFQAGSMIFKLSGEAHQQALSLAGARLFDPMGMGRPMKEWVDIPAAHSTTWEQFADAACRYVAALTQK